MVVYPLLRPGSLAQPRHTEALDSKYSRADHGLPHRGTGSADLVLQNSMEPPNMPSHPASDWV